MQGGEVKILHYTHDVYFTASVCKSEVFSNGSFPPKTFHGGFINNGFTGYKSSYLLSEKPSFQQMQPKGRRIIFICPDGLNTYRLIIFRSFRIYLESSRRHPFGYFKGNRSI